MQLRTLAVIAALGAGMTVTTAASAQVPTWHGFYLDGALGGRSTDTSTNLTVSGVAGSQDQDFGKTNFLAEFTGGWRWAPAGAPVVVGVAGFIDAAGTNAGESSFSDPTSSGSFKLKQTNRYGISVDVGPNWRTMPYGKITYAWSRFEGELNASGCNSVSGAQTTSGWGFGAGVRHLQTANLYFFAEVLYQDYGNERFNQTLTCGGVVQAPANLDFSASNLIGLIGAGWKF
jgi:opacity protein-like surface antigen